MTNDLPPRLSALARRWESVKLLVGRANVRMHHAFFRSCHFWQSGQVSDRKGQGWGREEPGDLYSAHAFHEPTASVLIGGDCRGNLSLQNGGLVQIYGDLSSRIQIGGQGEVVIGGSLMPHGTIEADGIHDVFVHGDLNGTVQSSGSLKIWVCGNFGGNIRTGDPSTELYVAGDVSGQIKPSDSAELLYLDVDGFVPYATLKSIAEYGYGEFNSSVGFSDQAPGLYPPDWEDLAKHSHHCRWTIHRTKGSAWDLPSDFGPLQLG